MCCYNEGGKTIKHHKHNLCSYFLEAIVFFPITGHKITEVVKYLEGRYVHGGHLLIIIAYNRIFPPPQFQFPPFSTTTCELTNYFQFPPFSTQHGFQLASNSYLFPSQAPCTFQCQIWGSHKCSIIVVVRIDQVGGGGREGGGVFLQNTHPSNQFPLGLQILATFPTNFLAYCISHISPPTISFHLFIERSF